MCSTSRSAFPRQPQTLHLAFFVVPLDDGEQRDRGADEAEGADHFQERAQRHASVRDRAGDVAGVVQDRAVQEGRGNRGDVGNEVAYACSYRELSLLVSMRLPPSRFSANLLDCGSAEPAASPARYGFRGLPSPFGPERVPQPGQS